MIIKGDCVTGSGKKNAQGYHRVMINRRSYFAHRLAYTAFYGEIPKGYIIHHICNNRECVNPLHLLCVTQKEHMKIHGLAGIALKYSKATHCPKGHLLDGQNKKQRFCRTCKAEAQKKYKESHRDQINSYRRAFRAARKESTIYANT